MVTSIFTESWFFPYDNTSNNSSSSLIPSKDNGFFKFVFKSLIPFKFRKLIIRDAWLSDNSHPLVNAPDWSFLPCFNNSSTPFVPNLSSLSIDFSTLYCLSSSILSSLIKPCRIFLFETFIVNWSLDRSIFLKDSPIILHISASAWDGFASPIISASSCEKARYLAESAFSCLKTLP